MKCPRCQAENTAAQKLCGACGAPLAQARAKFESPKSYTLAEELGMRPLDNVGVGVSLEGPATDFATLAKSFGLYGDGPILDPEDIRPALQRGLKVVK